MPIDLPLKYGCNPNQPHARLSYDGPGEPLKVRNGNPSFINLLDALRGWQLVRDLKTALQAPAAASMKHVSPAGAAIAPQADSSPRRDGVGVGTDATFRKAHFYDPDAEWSPVAAAYAQARSSDRSASFGDFVAVSEPVDRSLADLIKPEVSDGIIAPGFEPGAFDTLASKKGGKYVILEIDPDYAPSAADGLTSAATEHRVDFGFRLEQSVNDLIPGYQHLQNVVTRNTDLPESVKRTLLVLMVTLKHTQSNSVALGLDGQAIGIGAGQQSRIACTRLACEKAERFLLKSHPKTLGLTYKDAVRRPDRVNASEAFVMWDQLGERERAALREQVEGEIDPITPKERAAYFRGAADVNPSAPTGGLCCASDAFFPFRDNLDRLAASGVKYIAQAGGSTRDDLVIQAANEHAMAMAMTGLRLFLH